MNARHPEPHAWANRGTWQTKLRWKILIGVVAIGAICGCFLRRSDNSAGTAVEATRRALRQEGFKTDLPDFNFSTSPDSRVREAALTNVVFGRPPSQPEDYQRRQWAQQTDLNALTAASQDAAIISWRSPVISKDFYGSLGTNEFWPTWREIFAGSDRELDTACAAALSGPIRFELDASRGHAMLMPQIAKIKHLAQSLGTRVILNLRDGRTDAAWTNLLSVTRLVTAWEPEPTEISHLVRFACAAIVFNTTWQALQTNGWTDNQLSSLHAEWTAVEFFKGLPETAAFARACAAATCQLERQQPLGGTGITLKEAVRSPRQAWGQLNYHFRRLSYRRHGSYEDEKALLLHFRDREVELRRAVQSRTWAEMCQLPGVTNHVPFQSKHSSSMQAMLNTRQLSLRMQGQGQGLVARAADAEARRRLIITAIALERFRLRYGAYPKSLSELTPDFIKNLLPDFMDGQPLRYRLTEDGHFVLYSVGLDGADHGGSLRAAGRRERPYPSGPPFGIPPETDLVWPRPASPTEIVAKQAEDKQVELERAEAARQAEADRKREAALERAALLVRLEQLATQKPSRRIEEPLHQGQRLSDVLRNARALGTNSLALNELLTLRQITTGEEPEIVTFELPIRYDVLTNLGELRLLVDAPPEEDWSEGGDAQECKRATNGSCLLVWHAIYDPPGKHFLQAKLSVEGGQNTEPAEIKGPLLPLLSTDLLQLDSFNAFGTQLFLQTWLAESNGIYQIEIQSPAGEVVKTFRGTTSNGVIEVVWDLIDDHGRPYPNESLGTVYHVTLPASGRTQTVR